jgi:hypothetical protein
VSRRTHTSKKVKAAKSVDEEITGSADKQDSSTVSLDEIKEIESKPTEETKTQISFIKDNQEQILDDSKTLIPRYANVVKNYQEWALESTARIVEDYVETQKSVINSVYESTIPYYENVNREYGNWSSEIWAISASIIADNISASTRINNDILFVNIDAMGRAFERAKQHTEELSRINVDNAKTIANTAAEFSANRQSVC